MCQSGIAHECGLMIKSFPLQRSHGEVTQGYTEVIWWDVVKNAPHKNLKIWQLVAVPHKSRLFCTMKGNCCNYKDKDIQLNNNIKQVLQDWVTFLEMANKHTTPCIDLVKVLTDYRGLC